MITQRDTSTDDSPLSTLPPRVFLPRAIKTAGTNPEAYFCPSTDPIQTWLDECGRELEFRPDLDSLVDIFTLAFEVLGDLLPGYLNDTGIFDGGWNLYFFFKVPMYCVLHKFS